MKKRYHHRVMKFVFLAVLVTVFSLSGHLAFAQEGKKIIEVVVDGLKNVPLKNVWEVTKTRKGQIYKQEAIDSDLRSLFDLNLFSSINIDVSDKDAGVKVAFIVVEKMIIKQIDFKGNKVFKASASNALALMLTSSLLSPLILPEK